MSEFTVITDSQVFVRVSSNASTFNSERRVQKDQTIGDLKGKLELQTGCNSTTMKLEVFDKNDKFVCRLDNDDALFGSYPVDNEMRIHVTDPTKTLGEFEDVSKVEKFELSSEEYAKRTDSVRAFKERNKLGRFADRDPEEEKRKEQENLEKERRERELAGLMNVGDRMRSLFSRETGMYMQEKTTLTIGCPDHQYAYCEVSVPKTPTRRGEVMFIGETDFKSGMWIGIKYDEPVGKNDGSVNGRKYFECTAKYGGFVKPEHVQVGDYPEEGLDSDLDEI